MTPTNRQLVHEANDLLIRLTEARNAAYHQFDGMPRYRRLQTTARKAFLRLRRRLFTAEGT